MFEDTAAEAAAAATDQESAVHCGCYGNLFKRCRSATGCSSRRIDSRTCFGLFGRKGQHSAAASESGLADEVQPHCSLAASPVLGVKTRLRKVGAAFNFRRKRSPEHAQMHKDTLEQAKEPGYSGAEVASQETSTTVNIAATSHSAMQLQPPAYAADVPSVDLARLQTAVEIDGTLPVEDGSNAALPDVPKQLLASDESARSHASQSM